MNSFTYEWMDIFSRYLKHLAMDHKGCKGFVCETCGKKFASDKSMEAHQKVWTLTKFYSICFLLYVKIHWLDFVFFHSFQQLQFLGQGPLKGFLSWHG